MRANELMIGDWLADKDGDKVCVENIISFEFDCYYGIDVVRMNKDGRYDKWTVAFEEAQPIPLTAEVLEKNGFTCDANGMNDSDELVVSVEYGEYQRNTDDGFKMLADGKVIKYVHELQHALRLCGIEKDIVL